jgi:uncharacterized caspase-like protein
MAVNMEKSPRDNMAIIMFAGHATTVGGDNFYFLPNGIDTTNIEASAYSANEFRIAIAKLAAYGRVLVLLDACRSGTITSIGPKLALDGARLGLGMAQPNVTVFTSSNADELSIEHERWGHGAFTKVLLDALSRGDYKNGVISISALQGYLESNLPSLTNGSQHLGVESRFSGDILLSRQ